MESFDDANHPRADLERMANIFDIPEGRIGTEAYTKLLRGYLETLETRPMSPIELAHLERDLPMQRYGTAVLKVVKDN